MYSKPLTRGFEPVNPEFIQGADVTMPLRATKTSAGYDFYALSDFSVAPQGKVFFWTNLKALMPEDEFLAVVVPSSVGTKKNCMMANTVGIVDSDYYDNETTGGNIGICLRNMLPNIALGETVKFATYDLETNEEKVVFMPTVVDKTVDHSVHFKAGDKVAQGIFIKYQKADNCNSDATRIGGFGSTNK